MKVFKVLLFVVSFITLFCTQLFSSYFGLGVTGGYLRSGHSFSYSQFAINEKCFCFNDGAGDGYYFGLLTQIPIHKELIKISLKPQITYESLPFGVIHDGDKYPSLINDGNGGYKTVLSQTQFVLNVKYEMFNAALLFKFSLVDIPIGLTVGPSFSYIFSTNYKEKYEIVTPDSVSFKRDLTKPYTYENKDRTIVIYDAELPGAIDTRFSIIFGIHADIDLEFLTISPHLLYDYALTKATNAKCPLSPCFDPANKDWMINSLKGGIDIILNF